MESALIRIGGRCVVLGIVLLLASRSLLAADPPLDAASAVPAQGVYDEVQHRSLSQAAVVLSISPDMLPEDDNFKRLDARLKFKRGLRDSVDPWNTFITVANAGYNTLADTDTAFGDGWAGFGRRVGTYQTDDFVSDFFMVFLFPSMFRQDPRYHRVTYAPVKVRLFHALTHVIISQTDDNHLCLNYGELLGTPASSMLENVYNIAAIQGFKPTARRDLISIGSDAAWDVFTEFIPDVVRRVKIRNIFLQRLEFEAIK